jgi:uncharacterized protein
LVTREQALQALRDAGCSPEVIKHCLAVERLASEIAWEIQGNGHSIDLGLIRIGALLHDIGRSRTHSITHGVVGGEILRSEGLGEFAGFAENHLGVGIPAREAREAGLPEKDFTPRTLEEKVVAYADKFVEGDHVTSYERAVEWFKRELGAGHPALERFEKLHNEIQSLRGDG